MLNGMMGSLVGAWAGNAVLTSGQVRDFEDFRDETCQHGGTHGVCRGDAEVFRGKLFRRCCLHTASSTCLCTDWTSSRLHCLPIAVLVCLSQVLTSRWHACWSQRRSYIDMLENLPVWRCCLGACLSVWILCACCVFTMFSIFTVSQRKCRNRSNRRVDRPIWGLGPRVALGLFWVTE